LQRTAANGVGEGHQDVLVHVLARKLQHRHALAAGLDRNRRWEHWLL
jgi:hypothetical protein